MTTPTRRQLVFAGSATLAVSAARLRPAQASAGGPPISIFASADHRQALPEVLRAYGAQTIDVAYRSMIDIAKGLRQGHPSDIVFSADEQQVLQLAADGLLADAGIAYAEGRLALMVNRRSALVTDISLGAIAEAARNDVPFRIALADPTTVSYGERAMDVLERWSVDQLLGPRLLYAEDAAETVRLVVSGAAEIGLVAKSLTSAPAVQRATLSVDIPPGWHRPLVHRMALTRTASDQARGLFTFLQSDPVRQLFARHGYAVPDRGA